MLQYQYSTCLYLFLVVFFCQPVLCQVQSATFQLDESSSNQTLFTNDPVDLPWGSSVPDRDILWCYWRFYSHGAWDEFLGYHNGRKERMNISSWHHGWRYTNTEFPCLGGIKRSNVTTEFSGEYQMVIGLHNSTEFQSQTAKVNVIACTQPDYVQTRKIKRLEIADDDGGTLEFSCILFPMTIWCNASTGHWNYSVKPCVPDNVFLIIILCVALVTVPTVFILIKIKRRKQQLTSQNGQGTEMESLTDLKFQKTFGGTKDYMVVKDKTKLVLSVTLNKTAKVTWSRNNLPFDDLEANIEEAGLKYIITINRVTLEMCGVYKCTAESDNTKIEHSKHIYVITGKKSKPYFLTQLEESHEMRPGSDHSIKTKVGGIPRPKVTCYRDGKPLQQENVVTQIVNKSKWTEVSINFTNVTLEDVCIVQIQAENKYGKAEQRCLLYALYKPVFSPNEQQKIAMTAGESKRITTIVRGFPLPNIAWFIKGDGEQEIYCKSHTDEIDMVTVSTYLDLEMLKLAQNKYKVTATAGKSTHQWSLIVGSKPEFVIPPHGLTCYEGDHKEISVKVKGYPKPTIKWIYGTSYNIDLFIDDKEPFLSKLKIKGAVIRHTGQYEVQAHNDLGSISQSFELNVLEDKSYITCKWQADP